MVESSGSDYTSNDINSMDKQIPVDEREGEYERLGEFNLEEPDDEVKIDEALEYLFEDVMSEKDVDVDINDALEAQYGPDRKYEDTSGLID